VDPVIIAGAGPVGLALALGLARHGVPSIVLDETDGAGARAGAERTAVLSPPTAGLVARLGYAGVHGDGLSWTAWRTVRRRQEAVRVDFEPGSAPAPDSDPASPLHISQARLERGLRAAAAASPAKDLVRIVPRARVDTLEQDGSGVTVHTKGTDATWWRGSYLAGCDGSRSTVRKLLGVRFPGRTAVDRYAVAALRVGLPAPTEALLHLDPPGAGLGPEVTARPLPDGVWRLDWLLPANGGPLTSDDLVARIRGTLAAWNGGEVPPYELLGSAEHPVHQRLARDWRAGRVFLAGDAAHLTGALGAQSVEEGLRDADNLAWKLSTAWHYGASGTLLDSYQAERRGAVGARLRATDQVLPLLRADGAWHSVRRSMLSGVSGSGRRYAELLTDGHLGRGPLGAPPVYARSPLALPAPRGASGAAASPLVAACATPVGAAVTDVEVTALDGSRARLYERLGRHLLVVLIAPGTGVWESRHWLTAGLMPRLAKAVAALPTRAELLVAEAYPGSTAHGVLLIRPDGHLVTVMTGCRPAELYSYADLARGGPPVPAQGTEQEPGQGPEQADTPSSEPSEPVSGRTR